MRGVIAKRLRLDAKENARQASVLQCDKTHNKKYGDRYVVVGTLHYPPQSVRVIYKNLKREWKIADNPKSIKSWGGV